MTNRNACRHFLGLYPAGRETCAKGRDVRAWAMRCNGGSNKGIGLRLPCTKQAPDAEKPLFDCPEIDRRSDEEVEQRDKEHREHMGKVVSGLAKIEEMRAKMIAKNLATAKATCPWCGEKDALKISCAIGVNNHLRVHCGSCDVGFLE